MIIEPKTRGFICVTSHPKGCAQNVLNQINYIKSKEMPSEPKNVLVIGASTGFGLSSRITAAFGSNASTIGVFFEKPPQVGRPATAGWYNSAAFERFADNAGLYAKSINGDAFSNEIKEQTLDLIQADLGKIDLLIYSLASPVRKDPNTGTVHRSTLKPIGEPFTGKTVDFHSGIVKDVTINPCIEEEIANTIKVMGGEDWTMWIEELKKRNLLSDNFKTVAYSYIGPSLTKAVYRDGTIGQAKDHLEATAFKLSDILKDVNGQAFVSVNKALVTQSSSAIPVIPLYISLLYKVMREKGIHEGCIEQIQRLFAERLFEEEVPVDEKGRIRVDDWEMRPDVQEEVLKLWAQATTETLPEIGDLPGYTADFYSLFGFRIEGVDYEKDVDEMMEIPSISTLV